MTHGDPRTTPGGKGKDFAYLTRIELRRADWIQETKSTPRIGISIAARTIKNKTFAPQRTALVDFYFARLGDIAPGSYDVAQDIMLAAMELDIIRRGGSTYRFNDQRWTGKEPVLASLREDLDLRRTVYSETMRAAGLNPDPALAAAPTQAPGEEAVTDRRLKRSRKQEQATAKAINGRTQPGSGSGWVHRNDVRSDRFLVENKRTDNERSITIKADDLRQLRINAARLGSDRRPGVLPGGTRLHHPSPRRLRWVR